MRFARSLAALFALLVGVGAAQAEPPAKDLFGAKRGPAPLAPASYGSYSKGCLSGGEALPVDGPGHQVMRLSRNRNWGHPELIVYLEKLAVAAREEGWPGLLVGDLAQPRGGPMTSGHRSHQIGLDADIWLNPMPDRRMTRQERENISAVSVLTRNQREIDRKIWSPLHLRLLRRAASFPQVARIFVNPVIKRELCQSAGRDRGWLRKIRPWGGHHYHFHVRLACPPGGGCVDQAAPPKGDGCGAELESWFKPPDPNAKKTPPKKRRVLTMVDLPRSCRVVLDAP